MKGGVRGPTPNLQAHISNKMGVQGPIMQLFVGPCYDYDFSPPYFRKARCTDLADNETQEYDQLAMHRLSGQ